MLDICSHSATNHIRDYLQGRTPSLAREEVPDFLAWGRRQGMAPLAYLAARAALPDSPQVEQQRLTYIAHCAQVRGWHTALAQAMQALQQAGLDPLCFKGPSLAVQFWPTPPARRYSDLDLLCRPADAAIAEEVLFSLGYDHYYPTKRDLIAPIERRKKVAVYRRGNTVLDLHYGSLLGSMASADSLEALFRRATHFQLGSSSLATLSTEDTLLMLAWHGGKHLYHKLSQVVDVLFLLQHSNGLNWDYVLHAAQRNSLQKSLSIALELVRRIFGDDSLHGIPLQGLPDASRVADLIIRRVLHNPSEPGLKLALRIQVGQASGLRHLLHEIHEKNLSPGFVDVLYTGRKLPYAAYGLSRLHRLITKGRSNV